MGNSTNDILLTVLMPAYNTEKYIGEAIESVLNQSFPYFELLVINDGSTDDTLPIIESFKDPRIVIINQRNGGVARALNKGLQHSKAKYIVRFDSDDVCDIDRLKIQYEFMESNPQYILAGSDAAYIDMNGEYIFSFHCRAHTDDEIRQLPLECCPFLHVAVIFKKQEVLDAGGYNDHAHTFEDHLLWSAIIKKGKVCNLARKLVKVRFNPESVTIDEKWRGPRFKTLKYTAIQKGFIEKHQASELLQIIQQQNNAGIKNGSYYSLLAKKYLWNNHQPKKARKNIVSLIKIHPLNIQAYILWIVSFLPGALIKAIYNRNKAIVNNKTKCQHDNELKTGNI